MAAQPPPPTAPPAPAAKVAVTPASGSYIGVMVQEIDGIGENAQAAREAGVRSRHVEADSPADKGRTQVRRRDPAIQRAARGGMEQFSAPGSRDSARTRRQAGNILVMALRRPWRLRWPLAIRVRRDSNSNTFSVSPGDRLNFKCPDMPRSFYVLAEFHVGIEGESLEGPACAVFRREGRLLVRS